MGSWSRHSTIADASSHGDNSNMTTWNATCSADNFEASPWAPFPIYDHKEGFWHVLWVSYGCDLSWVVRVGVANIFGARSTVPGVDGLSGPYQSYGIIIGPNATNSSALRWGDLSECSACFDASVDIADRPTICGTDSCSWDNTKTGQAIAISPWVRAVDDDTFLAFLGTTHVLASAPNVKGPWTVWNDASVGQVLMSKMSTTASVYCENPVVVSPVHDPAYPKWPGRTGYIAVFDTVSPSGGYVDADWGWWPSGSSRGEAYGFGMSYSDWGYLWTDGEDVAVSGGVRTPLGLIEEDDGSYTLIFTRRFPDCAYQTLVPGSRGDAANDVSMCANMYSARFALSWVAWD